MSKQLNQLLQSLAISALTNPAPQPEPAGEPTRPKAECAHIRANGMRCRAVAMNNTRYCYYHGRAYQRHRIQNIVFDALRHDMNNNPAKTKNSAHWDDHSAHLFSSLNLPVIEDASTLAVVYNALIQATLLQQISERRAATVHRMLRSFAVLLEPLKDERWDTDEFKKSIVDSDPDPLPHPYAPQCTMQDVVERYEEPAVEEHVELVEQQQECVEQAEQFKEQQTECAELAEEPQAEYAVNEQPTECAELAVDEQAIECAEQAVDEQATECAEELVDSSTINFVIPSKVPSRAAGGEESRDQAFAVASDCDQQLKVDSNGKLETGNLKLETNLEKPETQSKKRPPSNFNLIPAKIATHRAG